MKPLNGTTNTKNDEVLIENFWGVREPHALLRSDLGWGKRDADDALSDKSEDIFRYYVDQMGLNIAFFWLEDRRFYYIYTEEDPVPVVRVDKDPNWDGQYLIQSFIDYGSTGSQGETIATFDDETKIWEELTINGKHLEEILANSVITNID